MANYYFDIETSGVKNKSPYDFEIITIQYQKIWQETGLPIDGESLTILKSWDSSEEEIIKQFLQTFKIDQPFHFVPVGNRLRYEFIVIAKRAKEYNIEINLEEFLKHPYIDINSLLVILNKGSFKGSRLDVFTKKEGRGADILVMYEKKDYAKILHYIEQETNEFLKLYQWFLKSLPDHYKNNYQK